MFWNRSNEFAVTRNGIYAKAFRTLSMGLWLTFAGMLMGLGAIALLTVMAMLKARGVELGAARHVFQGTLGILGGGALLFSLWGKYRCFELQNPMEFGHRLPGHKYLQVAFWADVLSFALKTSARSLGVAQLRFLAVPATIVSQVVFLLFLRKMADLVGRPDLRRSISWIFGLATGSVLAPLVWLAL